MLILLMYLMLHRAKSVLNVKQGSKRSPWAAGPKSTVQIRLHDIHEFKGRGFGSGIRLTGKIPVAQQHPNMPGGQFSKPVEGVAAFEH